MRGHRTDEQLARAAGRGEAAAFDALYARHHRPLLSFARHMVGGVHDAEDVVQHTFIAADRSFRAGSVPKAVRAWLYTVARNRCVSVLRARRQDVALGDAEPAATEGLAASVEQREELRALLADLRGLPDDQRAALLLTELGDLTHAEVARVIGVRPRKVKALVFQSREALAAAAHARMVPCRAIREELSVATGAALRKRHLRNHLSQCEGCRDFAAEVRRQRAALAAVLPVVPGVALYEGVVAGVSGGAAAAAGAGGALTAGSLAAKLFTIVAVGGAAAGGGAVGMTELHAPRSGGDRPAVVRAAPPPPRVAPSDATSRQTAVAAPRARGVAPARHDAPKGDRAGSTPAGRSERAPEPPTHAKPAPPHQAQAPATSPAAPKTPPGQAKKHAAATTPAAPKTPPGQAKKQAAATTPAAPKTPPGQAKKQAATTPAAPKTPPGQAKKQAAATTPPAATTPAAPKTPPGQAKKQAAATPAPPPSAAPPAPAPPGKARGHDK